MSLPAKLKKAIDALIGILSLAKWIPFLGKWKHVALTASTLLALVSGLLARCEGGDIAKPIPTPTEPPATVKPTESPTPAPTALPTPKPTPRPPRIIIDRAITAGEPFEFRYTAPFQYNVSLWADKYRLGYLGKAEDGTFISRAVYLNTPGKRRLSVRDAAGRVLAEQIVEVQKSQNPIR